MRTKTKRSQRPKTQTVSIKGIACIKCGCKKFVPTPCGGNGTCVHCGRFQILWGAY